MKISIQDAINWIEGNLEDELTLQSISKFIGYSEYYTSRKFKEYTGSTLRKYITLRRLSKAAKEIRMLELLILHSNMVITHKKLLQKVLKILSILTQELIKRKTKQYLIF